MTIRLLIAEDHDLVREGLRATFEGTEIDIVGEATTGSDAVQLASADGADVMLLDIKMPNSDGFEVLQQLQSTNKKLAILIYSQHERLDFQVRARRLGASGYLTKQIRADELVSAIREVGHGGSLWPQFRDDSPR